MNETAVVVTKSKKPANQTQAHKDTLGQVQADACDAYVRAIRSIRNTPNGLTPTTADRIDGQEIRIENGLVTAMIDGEAASDYEVITWIISGSVNKGIHHVKIGALVMAGIHELSLFQKLRGFDPDDPNNVGLQTMKIVDVARAFYQNNLHESPNLTQEPDSVLPVGRASVDSGCTAGSIDFSHVSTHGNLDDEPAESTGGMDENNDNYPAIEKDIIPFSKVLSAADPDTSSAVEMELSKKSKESQKASEEFGEDSPARPNGREIEDHINVQEPTTCKSNIDHQFAEAELPAILKAFNEKVPTEAKCLKQFRRHTHSQFCDEIRIGRLLVNMKQERKSSALYKKWRCESFPEAKFNKHCISRCTRYGQFEKSLKSKRGLLLEDTDIRLCSQKAMQAIGGYKLKNADDLINEVVSLLDQGIYLSADAASQLVRTFKAKVTKPKQIEEDTPPPVPCTIQELFELSEKWLSPAGRKHMSEFQELLEAIETEIKAPAKEAAVVLLLVKIFTVL